MGIKNDMNNVNEKFYLTTKKNKPAAEGTNEQKVLPPLKHKPKKFLPQMHGHFDKDNLIVNLGNINSLMGKNAGVGLGGPQSMHHTLNQKNKPTTHQQIQLLQQ